MKIEIDIDDIMPQILLETIGNVHSDITQLKEQEVLETWQVADLEYDLKLFYSLKNVYRYFSRPDEWSKDIYDIIDLEIDG